MNWFKTLFRSRPHKHATATTPPRPPDWNLTLDDLFAEMESGKRKSVGNPEAEWARQYERSLLPEGSRFPRKGNLYESNCDQAVLYMTAWSAPYTGGGEAVLFKGERIWIDNEPRGGTAISTYAIPVEYSKLEERMVPKAERENPRYDGFRLHLKTVDLNINFTLIRTGFDGNGEQEAECDAATRAP